MKKSQDYGIIIQMKKNAFTLIEMVVVIAILAILALTVIVPITSALRLRLDAAANKLVHDMRYAQQLAITRHVECGVSFDTADNSYFVYIGSTSNKATDPLSKQDLEVDFDTDQEFNGVDLISTNIGGRIYFDYLGVPYSNNGNPLSTQGRVTLQYGNDTERVFIEPNTGQIKL